MRERCVPLVVALLVAGGCRAMPSASGTEMARTDLYFGLSRADGAAVTDEQFRAFLAEVVTPRFPAGLTVLAGDGQWRDERTGRVTREPCRVLILLHEPTATDDAAVEQIRAAYKRQFGQQSVLRADSAERVSF